MESSSDVVGLIREKYLGIYDRNDSMVIVRSPGRINLIGEHTDYNEGFVLPSAIDRAIYLAVGPCRGFDVSLTSLDLNDQLRFDVREAAKSQKAWANYLIGIVHELNRAGHHIGGFNCVFSGDIPIGAGMSSSAGIEAGLAFALNSMFDLGIGRRDLARIAQRSENEFVGVRCGIMDQFANLLSKGESALHLDCRSLQYEYIPFIRRDLEFVLCDTGVKHSLAFSEYNLRREQCETGAGIIGKYFSGVRSLRDVEPEMLREHKDELGDTIYGRCKYVVEENARVNLAGKYLRQNDYDKFGELLYASHEGLRDEYQVSCRELDVLVDAATNIDGVLGARMMGGGFGGCTLNLVDRESAEEFKSKISESYRRETGKVPQLYECSLMPGTDLVPD